MILVDMSNIGMFKRVNKAASNAPVIVIVSDIETLGNRYRNRGGMIRVFGHTLGRRIPADGDELSDKRCQKILTYLYLCARCSEIQRRLRMRKAKEGERARPYIPQLILG